MFLVIFQFLPLELISSHQYRSKKSNFKTHLTCCRLLLLQKHVPYRTPMRIMPRKSVRGPDPKVDSLKVGSVSVWLCSVAAAEAMEVPSNRNKTTSGIK